VSVHVGFAPKAPDLLRGSEVTRWATSGCEQAQQNSPLHLSSPICLAGNGAVEYLHGLHD
jgi:hypothetical protein